MYWRGFCEGDCGRAHAEPYGSQPKSPQNSKAHLQSVNRRASTSLVDNVFDDETSRQKHLIRRLLKDYENQEVQATPTYYRVPFLREDAKTPASETMVGEYDHGSAMSLLSMTVATTLMSSKSALRLPRTPTACRTADNSSMDVRYELLAIVEGVDEKDHINKAILRFSVVDEVHNDIFIRDGIIQLKDDPPKLHFPPMGVIHRAREQNVELYTALRKGENPTLSRRVTIDPFDIWVSQKATLTQAEKEAFRRKSGQNFISFAVEDNGSVDRHGLIAMESRTAEIAGEEDIEEVWALGFQQSNPGS